jgi:bacterial/archaeal transporter family protein
MAASRFNPTSAARAGVDHWLALCLACTLLWGVWGFLSKLLADRVGAIETQLLFTLGMLPAGLIAAWRVGASALTPSPRGIVYGLLNGLLTALGTLCFFAALARVSASIVSPLIAAYPLVTVALAAAFLRERITPLQIAGAICAVIGLALLS